MYFPYISDNNEIKIVPVRETTYKAGKKVIGGEVIMLMNEWMNEW